MSDVAQRWRALAAGFSARVDGVDAGGWERPAPCDGWVARDVVRHVVGWMPGLLRVPVPDAPEVDDDPAGAWHALDLAVQGALDDPGAAGREVDVRGQLMPLPQAVATFCLADLLVHTWDLARATGQDEALDPDEVHQAHVGLSQVDEQLLVASGHYGPRVSVPDDADEQTRVIAMTGRDPQRLSVSRSDSSAL